MNSASPSGFLVVLCRKAYINARNPNYRGVDRVPEYPSDQPSEELVLDDYVFGNYKDAATNLITDYRRARELCQRLEASPREFEVLAWCLGVDDPILSTVPNRNCLKVLGFDVAVVSADCWSIVEDMPETTWAQPYQEMLNANGLFDERTIADEYLKKYRALGEADYDSDFQIGFVVQVAHG